MLAVGCSRIDNGWLAPGLLFFQRCHKRISHTDLRGDVARMLVTVTENPPQGRHMKAQTAFLDNDIGPHLLDQIALGQHSARSHQQGNQ
ncbi:hypothetical protein D3C87_1289400 [compost metagenome]